MKKNKDSLFSSTLQVGEHWKKHFFLQAQADLHVYYFLLWLLRFPNLHFLILKILYVPKFDAENFILVSYDTINQKQILFSIVCNIW